ncbi:MAG: amphi-Trp domain-containing protein [Clostridiaceae bacterium]
MKYQDTYVGSKADFGDYVKKTVPDLFAGRLAIEGKTVTLPTDKDLDYKVKFDEDEQSGSFTIKVAWKNEDVEVELEE